MLFRNRGVKMAAALATLLASAPALALEVVRTTRHGYIVTDELGSPVPYEGRVPVGNTMATLGFLAELTNLLSMLPDPPRADYVAVMQTQFEGSVGAFYLGLRNDTRGIGMRDPFGRGSELFDINNVAMTSWRVTGFVFFNHYALIDSDRGRYLICTQEFGHRWGVHTTITAQPGPPLDGGMPDAATDASMDPDGAASDASGDVAPPPDVPAPDSGLPLQEAQALLGRQRAHWSYFVHSEGSPMEGNNWSMISPGVFRTQPPTFRFSTVDLYLMGLLPASAVRPFYLIANPDVMGQRDTNGRVIFRESPPELRGRTITIRGTRVDYTIDDIIRANGQRVPDYATLADAGSPDAGGDGGAGDGGGGDGGAGDGGGGDGGPAARPQDMRVVWVLLAGRRMVNETVAQAFDDAIETCTGGYNTSTGMRSELVEVITQIPRDVPGTDAADGSSTTDVVAESSVGDGGTTDGGPRPNHAIGGCGCSTVGGAHAARWGLATACVAAIAVGRRRSRRSRAA